MAGRCTDTPISSVRGGYPTMLLAYVLRQTQDAQKVTQENYIGRVFSRSCSHDHSARMCVSQVS